MRFILYLSIFGFVTPALAQHVDLIIDCTQIVDNADYEPGVDVNGNLVTPADLPEGEGQETEVMSYPLEIPISVDMLELVNIDLQETMPGDEDSEPEANTTLTSVMVYEDGRVEYNGKDVSRDISVNCMANPEKPEEILPSTLQQAAEAGISVELEGQNTNEQPSQTQELLDASDDSTNSPVQ